MLVWLTWWETKYKCLQGTISTMNSFESIKFSANFNKVPVSAILSHPLPCPTRKTSPPNALENYMRTQCSQRRQKTRTDLQFLSSAQPPGKQFVGSCLWLQASEVSFQHGSQLDSLSGLADFSTCSWRPLSKYSFLLRETYRADPGVSVPFKIDSSCQVDQSLDLGQ